jgi:hypothetical protein
MLCLGACKQPAQPLKTEASRTTKPWTYWWWLGSAATKADITDQLADMQKAGMGGVHIIPIYGVRGEEAHFLDYLSPEWQEAVDHTIQTADSLGMGVDLTLGTGWPFGGPMVSRQEAAKKVALIHYDFPQSGRLEVKLDSVFDKYRLTGLVSALAISRKEGLRQKLDISQPEIDLTVPTGDWQVLLLGESLTGQRVKRAAPGGEGLVMDYFNRQAVESYLQHHDSALTNLIAEHPPRAFYHDSYEAYGANWSADFLQQFEERRGYALTDLLPVLADTAHADYGGLLHDIRQTLSDLLYASFTQGWTNWSHEKGIETRNQAHGSPANILDLYGLASIPETESFGTSQFEIPGLRIDRDFEVERFGQPSPLMMKFASSPAHLMGKPMVSSETTTWLGNHFKVALSQVKPQVDELFTAGINHIFYHGMPYSPRRAGFPGWLFYASTNFNRQSHFWDELPQLNGYISRVQRYLQHTQPDHDLLLYFPIHDIWTEQKKDNWLLQLDVHKYGDWFSATPAGKTTRTLWDSGYTFDYLSDRQLQALKANEGRVGLHDTTAQYQAILLPPTRYLPLGSLRQLKVLAEAGVSVFFTERYPEAIPGYGVSEAEQEEFKAMLDTMQQMQEVQLLPEVAALDQVSFLRPESIKQQGLDFIRKRHQEGHMYFITNLANQFEEGPVRLSTESEAVEILNPMTGKRGIVDTQRVDGKTQIYLQLKPGASAILLTYDRPLEQDRQYRYEAVKGDILLDGSWQAKLLTGNTEGLPQQLEIDSLTSWTAWADSSWRHFSGKVRYTTNFSLPDDGELAEAYRLQFTQLRESARVILNGRELGTVWAIPYELTIPAEHFETENTLELIVQNLSVNRIIQLDQQEVDWKKFYDINFVDIQYRPFDASDWLPEPSGIIGDVKLQKIQYFY